MRSSVVRQNHITNHGNNITHRNPPPPTTQGRSHRRNVVTPAAAATTAVVSSSSHGRSNKVSSNQPSTRTSATTEVEYTAPHRAMTVEKQIVDELLLVCGVIGTTTKVPSTAVGSNADDDDDVNYTIVPVTDCVQWLQDLQRCLRRDDDVTRPISLLLHSWNIVVQKLLPLVYNTQYDTTLIITICKIIVLLTKPLHVQTIRAGRMMIHTKSSNANHMTEA